MKFFRSGRMTKTVALVSALAASAALAGCTSSTGGAPASSGSAAGGGTVDTPRATIAFITHGAPGDTFWDLVRKGAEDAAKKDNIELRYSSDPQAPGQATLVQSAIDSKVAGIAVTMPNPDAIGPAAQKAVTAGIPVVGLNAGMDSYQTYGLSGFFGQEEKVAGNGAGKRIAQEGGTKVLCVIHEQGNISQEDRCAGVKEGSNLPTENLYVNGQDMTAVSATVKAKLQQDPSIDFVMGLNAAVTLTAQQAGEEAGSKAKFGTFDTNAELVKAIEAGKIQWAVDQQPYLQGYLAVDSLWLAMRNGSTIGGGRPVYTGPAFVDSTNVAAISEAAQQGIR